jgi:hypothetical protein
MNHEPVAWIDPYDLKRLPLYDCWVSGEKSKRADIPLYTHPVKELTDEDIAKVVHELNQKANTPERWVTAMEIGAETIIQLRDELRKAQEK